MLPGVYGGAFAIYVEDRETKELIPMSDGVVERNPPS